MENLKNYFQKALPFLIAIIFFIVLSFMYFSPMFEGKVLKQSEQTNLQAMSQELVEFNKQTGEDSQWTNSVYGGMPAYSIHQESSYNIYFHIQNLLKLGLPGTTVAVLFIYMLGFYILLLSLKFNNWQSVLGGISFGFASYNIIIIAIGQITKTYAIAFMAPVIAGVLMTYRKKYIWGAVLTTFALGIQMVTTHIQITYYLFLMIFLLIIVQFVYAVIEKQLKVFTKATAVLVVAVLLAVLPNIANLATNYEYNKISTQGISELSVNESDNSNNKYTQTSSYAKSEALTLMIPNAKGGSSKYIGTDEEILKNVDSKFANYVSQSSAYFGNLPVSAGPIYIGAILMFLFIFGLFTIKTSTKWWLLVIAIFGILLSWGSNFDILTVLMQNVTPFYSSFDSFSMSLIITGFAIPLLAMLVLKEVIADKGFIKKHKIWFYVSLGVTAGISLVLYITPDTFISFLSQNEIAGFAAQKEQTAQAEQQMKLYIYGLEQARMEIFKVDAIRSFIFIIIGSALLWLYSSIKQFKESYLLIALAVLFLADMWTVDKRYLNEENFQKKSFAKNVFKKTLADEMIIKDGDPNYRVLSYLRNPLNDAYTSYSHKSIGGASISKLGRYQDIINRYLAFELQMVARAYQADTTGSLGSLFSKTNVLNMMNVKYIIFAPKVYELNWNSLGHSWFVDDYEIVENADAELAALARFNPKKTAIIDKHFKPVTDKLPEVEFFSLDTGYIQLTNYKPNHLTYKSATNKERLAVFSEIYYDKGWNAYVDGFPTEHIRVNYILRGMIIPKGVHDIEFKFEPKSYSIGQKVSMASSILVVLFLLALVGYTYKMQKAEVKED
ncbi:MAG: hypothetical protein DRJ10_13375 [Bacteroidetes bacterium]|nr:MAG: hypothetical protein DRJ10_13375 [Bacteroidota bacterium]